MGWVSIAISKPNIETISRTSDEQWFYCVAHGMFLSYFFSVIRGKKWHSIGWNGVGRIKKQKEAIIIIVTIIFCYIIIICSTVTSSHLSWHIRVPNGMCGSVCMLWQWRIKCVCNKIANNNNNSNNIYLLLCYCVFIILTMPIFFLFWLVWNGQIIFIYRHIDYMSICAQMGYWLDEPRGSQAHTHEKT